MVNRLMEIYAFALVAIILLLLLTTLMQRVRLRHRRRVEGQLSQRYMRIVTTLLLSNEELPSRFPMGRYGEAKAVLARVLARVASSLYGPDVEVVGSIAIESGVDRWLLGRVQRSRGYRRAYYMSLLASLPLAKGVVDRVVRYAKDGNRYVRFYVLMIRIGSDSSSALRVMTEYREPLNGFEVAGIVAMLRRGALPVACEPLLVAESRNLRIVGLSIVREFGIRDVRALLLDIATSDADAQVAQEALYTLVAIHSSLAHRTVRTSVRNMAERERHALCRCLAREGYSASALEELFGSREGRYAKRLVASYKRRIVWISHA